MGPPVCAAAEKGTKAPARTAETAKRTLDIASEYARIFKSSSICNLRGLTRLITAAGDEKALNTGRQCVLLSILGFTELLRVRHHSFHVADQLNPDLLAPLGVYRMGLVAEGL